MPQSPALGPWIRQRRISRGLTQHQLADRLGCSPSLLRKLESGERSVSSDLIERLAEELATDRDERRALLSLVGVAPPSQGPAGSSVATIPSPPGPLIGRRADLAAIQRQLGDGTVRLLTLVGPPGVGKTRLAQQAGRDMGLLFAEICYLPLDTLEQPDQVVLALARALALTESPGSPLLDQIVQHLRSRALLLILDNFEHLLDAGPVVAEILAACPQLRVIVTSRAPLRLRPEQVFLVEPLGLPKSNQPVQIMRAPAVQLFVDRALALSPRLDLEAAAQTVAEICARLDGLPLAIELAAAHSDRFSPGELLSRLEPLLPALVDGPRDLPARQRTLHSAITWSYALLELDERRLFARLGVFVNGWDQASAVTICCAEFEPRLIERLRDHSLIQVVGGRGRLLEALRQYALEQLAVSGEAAGMWTSHAAHFVALAVEAEKELDGLHQGVWFSRIDAEFANLRTAYDWSLHHDEGLSALRISVALFPYWRARGLFSEGRRWIEPLLDAVRSAEPPLLAGAYYVASYLASQQVDLSCYVLLDRALELYRHSGDRLGEARCLNLWGIYHRIPGSYDEAVIMHEASLAILQEHHEPLLEMNGLNNLGMALACLGDYGGAIARFEAAVVRAKAQGNRVRLANYLPNLAEALSLHGDRARAGECVRQALALAEALGLQEIIAEAQNGLGVIALGSGDLDEAERWLHRSLGLYEELGLVFAIVRVRRDLGYLALRRSEWALARAWLVGSLHPNSIPGFANIVAHAYVGLALVATKQGDWHHARQLFDAAEQLRQRYALRDEPEDAAVRARLVTALAATSRADGTTITPEQLLVELLEAVDGATA